MSVPGGLGVRARFGQRLFGISQCVRRALAAFLGDPHSARGVIGRAPRLGLVDPRNLPGLHSLALNPLGFNTLLGDALTVARLRGVPLTGRGFPCPRL